MKLLDHPDVPGALPVVNAPFTQQQISLAETLQTGWHPYLCQEDGTKLTVSAQMLHCTQCGYHQRQMYSPAHVKLLLALNELPTDIHQNDVVVRGLRHHSEDMAMQMVEQLETSLKIITEAIDGCRPRKNQS